MKTRNGFVSNSSSSSFVIAKESLTEGDLEELKEMAEENKWRIWETQYFVRGSSSAGVFSHHQFFDYMKYKMELDVGEIIFYQN